MITEALTSAVTYFAKEVLDSPVTLFQSCSTEPCYGAAIDIHGAEPLTIHVYVRPHSLKKMAHLFLLEESPDPETLEDLIQEVANIIVGRAKVDAAANDLHFDIGTPRYLGADLPVDCGDFQVNFRFEEEIFSVTGRSA